MMMSPLEILNRSGWMAVKAARQSAYEKRRWAEDPEFRKKKLTQVYAWKKGHKYTPRTLAQKQRRNLRRKIRYQEDPVYREQLLDAMSRRQRRMSLTRQPLPEVYELPWNIDELQEAALAELEGRDPKEAVRRFRRKENDYLYSTTPYPTRFGREISI